MAKTESDSLKAKEMHKLLKLAVNCKFITARQEKELLPELLAYSEKESEKGQGDPAVRFFLEKNIFSKEKIDLFYAIKKQIKTLMADKKFGKLGVANQFVSRENVQKALDIQISIFRKEKKSVKIGDILVNNKDISAADKTAIKAIEGDIIFDTDDMDSILKVEGNIVPDINVSCHQLIINGDILGNVMTSDHIDVDGNIGREPNPDGHPLKPVQVNTRGSIHVTQNIINAKIVAFGGINAQHADLVSSVVFSSRDLVVNNIFSSKEAPSILRIVREDYFEIERMNKAVEKKTRALDKILHKNEMDQLTKELMEQVQVQNGLLEKQNVISYLKKIIDDPDLTNIEDLDQKVESYEKKNKKEISIPENTKAHQFMRIILDKIKKKQLKNQKEYIRGLHKNIAAMYDSAVELTEKINQKYEIRSKEIEAVIKKINPEITQKKEEIEALLAQKSSLQIKQKKTASYKNPVIRVKNQIDRYTIIQGEKASRIIDHPIHGVAIMEDYASPRERSKILVKGYFE